MKKLEREMKEFEQGIAEHFIEIEKLEVSFDGKSFEIHKIYNCF